MHGRGGSKDVNGPRVLRAADYTVMPWKNGRGTTREIARYPQSGAFHWRLSIADIAGNGPFSSFPGCARTIMLLQGDGMRLAVGAEKAAIVDAPFHALDFDGAAATNCELTGGAVRDFNIMSAREHVRHVYEVVHVFPYTATINENALALAVFCLRGPCRARVAGHADVALDTYDTLLLPGSPQILSGRVADDKAAVVIVQFLPSDEKDRT